MNRLRALLSSPLVHQGISSFGLGALCSGWLLAALVPLRLAVGMNLAADTGILLAAGIVWLVATRLGERLRRPDRVAIALLFPAGAWALLAPRWLELCGSWLGSLTISRLANPVVSSAVCLLLAVVAAGPVWGAIALSWRQAQQTSRSAARYWLAGGSLGLLWLPATLLPFWGAATLLKWGIGAAAVLAAHRWLVRPAGDEAERSRETAENPAVVADRANVSAVETGEAILAALIGGGLALALFLGGQLLPRSAAGGSACVAGLLLGVLLATCRLPKRRAATTTDSADGRLTRLAAIAAVWALVLTAGYPVWMRAFLWLQAHVANPYLLHAGRAALLATLFLPGGWLLARLCRLDAQPSPGGVEASGSQYFWGRRSIALPCCALIGGLAAVWSGASPDSAALFLLSAASLMGVVTGVRSGKRAWRRAGLAAGLVLLGFWGAGGMRPDLSEKVLFSPSSLQAVRGGASAFRAAWIDDGRLVADWTSLGGRCSIWVYRGQQLATRRNGLLTDVRSADPRVCPHGIADILPATLPLVLHPGAQHILIVGMHAPSLEVCHRFPLQSVAVLDRDRESQSMLAWLRQSPSSGLAPLDAADYRFYTVDAALGLAAQHPHPYDVIVLPQGHPLDGGLPSQLTVEFYRSAAKRLSEEGILCQRLPYYDLGPELIRETAAAMQAAFSQVDIVESLPGELLLIGSRTARPIVSLALVERLKAPQCRTLLAESGWDWTVVLGRGGVGGELLQKWIGDASWKREMADGRHAFALPREVGLWGPKAESTRRTLARFGRSLADGLDAGEARQEVAQRLEDLQLALQIQSAHPDEPWAYRAAIKKRLQERPRTTIMQVKYEGLKRVLDPEDQRRKDYLLALDEAAGQPRPQRESILRLYEFVEPFDPLVSAFVHHETAALHARSSEPDPRLRYESLLRTVCYTAPDDRSVANLAGALQLLCEHEDLRGPEQRWDELNGLLQLLESRWRLRRAAGPAKGQSRFAQRDIEQSLTAATRALRTLETGWAERGLRQADWEQRKRVLEESLLRPLREDRSAGRAATALSGHAPLDGGAASRLQ